MVPVGDKCLELQHRLCMKGFLVVIQSAWAVALLEMELYLIQCS